jgi:hypothetical protein
MGTPIEDGSVQGDIGAENGAEAPGPNPAWNDVLSVLPEQFHEAVTPHFQKWDQSAQQRIEQANSQISQFEPFKPFVENGISPEDLEQGIQLMYHMNTNPQAVYQALAEAHGFGANQIESEETEEEEDGFQDPRFEQFQSEQAQLREGLDLVAQTILQQKQRETEAEAEAEIDAEMKALSEKHPGISEEFALSLMLNGFDANQIGERWAAMTQGILSSNPRPFAPTVMGSSSGGTGLPSQAIDPKTLGDKETRNLVVQMLNAANRES